MSRELAGIAKYVQRIALQAPEIQSTLATLRARGAIPGLYTEAGGVEDDERQSCCDPENNGAIEEDVDTHNPWSSDDGNAPEQYTSTPDGVTDCESGDAVKVNFVGGFSQAETCKECEPDETWEIDTYWRSLEVVPGYGATVSEAFLAWQTERLDGLPDGFSIQVDQDPLSSGNPDEYNALVRIVNASGDPGIQRVVSVDRFECGSSTADYCQLSEAPQECGDSWESNNTTEYSIRNGCLVASKCDPDASSSSLGCNESIKLCKDGVAWMFRPTSDGGWIQYDPDGIRTGGKYDKTGKRTAIIQPGQETMY